MHTRRENRKGSFTYIYLFSLFYFLFVYKLVMVIQFILTFNYNKQMDVTWKKCQIKWATGKIGGWDVQGMGLALWATLKIRQMQIKF